MRKKFLAFLNKEHFNYSEGFVDPYKFHATFYFLMKTFRLIDNEPAPKWANYTHISLIAFTFVGVLSTAFPVAHGLSNFELVYLTESGTYLVIIINTMCSIVNTMFNINSYHGLLRALREDFDYVCTTGTKYRDRFFANQLTTWKICVISLVFLVAITFGMFIFSSSLLIYAYTRNQSEDEWTRPMLFPYWAFQIDFSKTPVYELTFVHSNLTIITCVFIFNLMLQIQTVWIRQITTKADLVTWWIQDLLEDIRPANNIEEQKIIDGKIKFRMREIVKQHLSMYRLLGDYSKVYNKMLLMEQKIVAPIICLTSYSAAKRLETGEIHLILIAICIMILTINYIPNYLCTFLAVKVRAICDACWGIPFWNVTGTTIRPYLILIMQRSILRLPLGAPGFEEISLQTYSKKVTSAYSMFNMLRQMNL